MLLGDVPQEFLEECTSINSGIISDSDEECVLCSDSEAQCSVVANCDSESTTAFERDPRFIGPETQADILSLGPIQIAEPKRRRLHYKQPVSEKLGSDRQQDPNSEGQPEYESTPEPTPEGPRVVFKSRASKAAEALGVSTAHIKYFVRVRAPLIFFS